MSTGRAIAMFIGGALMVGVLWLAPWPVWVSLVLAVSVAAVVTLFVVRRPASFPEPAPDPALDPEPPVESRKALVSDVRLPSSRPDYDFLFSATVLWSPLKPVVDESALNLSALAIDSILKRARRITEEMDPERATLVQHELGSALGKTLPDATGYVSAVADLVRLTLPDGDRERLEKLATVRKDKDVWEHERIYEQNRRAYLSEDVLKDPGSAVVWWLSRNDDQVGKTVEDIGLLAKLYSAANNTHMPAGSEHFDLPPSNGARPEHAYSAVDHFEEFLRKAGFAVDDPRRTLYVQQVARVTAVHSADVAEEIRRRFDTQVTGDGSGPDTDEDG